MKSALNVVVLLLEMVKVELQWMIQPTKELVNADFKLQWMRMGIKYRGARKWISMML